MSERDDRDADRTQILFEQAIAIKEKIAQRAFLQKACGTDSALLRKVESLLAHDDPDDGFLEGPVVLDVEGPSPMHSPPIKLGDYRLLGVLDQGGMGIVFKAKQQQLGRDVAVKILLPTRDPNGFERFEREMRAHAKLDDHRNIVRIHDARSLPGGLLMVMEYIDGIDLQRFINPAKEHDPPQTHRTEHQLLTEDACEIAYQVAKALKHLHAKGHVHRDVKPGNVMLTKDGDVKCLDFGLILNSEDTSSAEQLTQTGFKGIMGTPAYMAPEQFGDPHGVTAFADIYSLGCTLFFLLSGRPPFKGNRDALKQAHERESPPDLKDLCPVPLQSDLVEIVNRMLEKDPADRYPSAADVAAALAPYRASADLSRYATEVAQAQENRPLGVIAEAELDAIRRLSTSASPIAGNVASTQTQPGRRNASWTLADTFELVNERLERVSYLQLWPPLDVTEGAPHNFWNLRTDKFYLAPPADVPAVVRDLITTHEGHKLDASAFQQRVTDFLNWYAEGKFADSDDPGFNEYSKEYAVFKQLFTDPAFEKARRHALEDYLTLSDGFRFNGPFLSVYNMDRTPLPPPKEHPSLRIQLRLTDYYTFRVMRDACRPRRPNIWPGPAPLPGPHLSKYLTSHFQRNLHSGMGLNLVVHTLQDDRMIITRRASGASNPSGEAEKYCESVGEGLNANDTDGVRMRPIDEIFRRCLKEELIGDDHLLDHQILKRFITGATLYLPDLVISLCGVVVIDCTADDIRRSFYAVRDRDFECEIVHDPQWDKQTGLPRFTPEGIDRFIRETLENRKVNDVWHEGSLTTVLLSAAVPAQLAAR